MARSSSCLPRRASCGTGVEQVSGSAESHSAWQVDASCRSHVIWIQSAHCSVGVPVFNGTSPPGCHVSCSRRLSPWCLRSTLLKGGHNRISSSSSAPPACRLGTLCAAFTSPRPVSRPRFCSSSNNSFSNSPSPRQLPRTIVLPHIFPQLWARHGARTRPLSSHKPRCPLLYWPRCILVAIATLATVRHAEKQTLQRRIGTAAVPELA